MSTQNNLIIVTSNVKQCGAQIYIYEGKLFVWSRQDLPNNVSCHVVLLVSSESS
jgi:hypothetical protein